MEKQYSVQFFNSVVSNMQQSCQNFVTFGQLVELSGYLSLEIDGVKKERYVLSELIQTTGNVISESYCTKVSRNCNPGWKPPGPKSSNIINQAPGRAPGQAARHQAGAGVRFIDQPVNRMVQRQQGVKRQFQLSRPRQGVPQVLSGPHVQSNPQVQSGSQIQNGSQVQIHSPGGSNRPQPEQISQNSNPDVQIISGPHPSGQSAAVQSGKVNDLRPQYKGFRRVKSPVPPFGHQDLRKQSMLRHHINSVKQQRLSEEQRHVENSSVMSGPKTAPQGRENPGNVKSQTDSTLSSTGSSRAVPFPTQIGPEQIQSQQNDLTLNVSHFQAPESMSEPQLSCQNQTQDEKIYQRENKRNNTGQGFSKYPNTCRGKVQNLQSKPMFGNHEDSQGFQAGHEVQGVVQVESINQTQKVVKEPNLNQEFQNQSINNHQRCQPMSPVELKDQDQLQVPLVDLSRSQPQGHSEAQNEDHPQVSHRQAKFTSLQVEGQGVCQAEEHIVQEQRHQDLQVQQTSFEQENRPMQVNSIPPRARQNNRQRRPSCSVIPQTAPLTELQAVPRAAVTNKKVRTGVHKPPVITFEAEVHKPQALTVEAEYKTDVKEETNHCRPPMRTEIYESVPQATDVGTRSESCEIGQSCPDAEFRTQQAETMHGNMPPVHTRQDQKLWRKPLPPMERKDETDFCADRLSNCEDSQIHSFTATTDNTPHGPCVIEMTSQGSSSPTEMKAEKHLQSSFQPLPPHGPRFPSPAQIEYAQQLVSPSADSTSTKRPKMSTITGKKSAASANQTRGKPRARKPKVKAPAKGKKGKRKSKTPRKSEQMDLSSEDENLSSDIPPANRTLRSSRIGPRKSYSENDDYLSDGLTEFLLKDDESNESK